MGLFSKPKAPAPLDVGAVTAASNAQNTKNAQQNAAYNRVNQTDDFGNTLNYTQTGTDANGNPTFSANQALGATGQQYASGLTGLGQQYMNMASGYDPSNMSMDAFNKAQNLYDSTQAPIIQRQNDQLDTKLKTQGLVPGTEAYDNAMKDQLTAQGNARNNFIGQTQGQMFNQGLQGTQEQASLYNPGVQFGNNVLTPSYAQVPGVNVANTDVSQLYGINQANQEDAYKQKMAQYNATMGAIGSIGSLALAPMTGGLSLGGLAGFGGSGLITGTGSGNYASGLPWAPKYG